MKLRAFKHVFIWTASGALFGAFFGAFSSFFHDGPSLMLGVEQSWWWFAIAAGLKAASDLKLPLRAETKIEPCSGATMPVYSVTNVDER